MNCFGLGESTAEEMLGNLTARGRDPEVGITVHEATITLRITAHGTSEADCQQKILDTQNEIHSIMGDYVFGEEDEELHHVVVRLLNERKLSLATVESGTGGLLAHRLTDCEAANDCYRGGIVVPDNNSRRRLFFEGNHENDDSRFENWNSSETARLLVENCRHQFGTDFALSITECPIFNPDATDDEAPRTFVAFSGEHGTDVTEISLFGDPAITKSRVAKAALDLIRLHLIR